MDVWLRKMTLSALKYSAILVLALLVGVLISGLALGRFSFGERQSSTITNVSEGGGAGGNGFSQPGLEGGEGRVDGPPVIEQGGEQFGDWRVSTPPPESIGEALSIVPLALLPGRQRATLPIVETTETERRALAQTTRDFLAQWETFSASEEGAAYRDRLEGLTTNSGLDRISDRREARQTEEVGPCPQCTVGQRWLPLLDPGEYMLIRRLGDDGAYITTQGIIEYQGKGALSGKRFRRSYALVLTPDGEGGYRIARAVAESIGQA